jgi:hypothetical protein
LLVVTVPRDLDDVVILDIELPFNVVTDAEIVENIAYDIAERGSSMCCCYPTPNEEGVIVLNANISATSWRSVLLLEEIGVPRKKPPTCRKSLTNFIT